MLVTRNVVLAVSVLVPALTAQTVVAPVASLTATQPLGDFGHAIAVDGNVLAVGSPFGDTPTAPHGAVQVFERIAGTWTPTSLLLPPNVASSVQQFGASVAVKDDVIAVGYPSVAAGGHAGAGVVFVYVRSALGWSQVATLSEPATTFQAQFGIHVDIARVGSDYRIAALAQPLPAGHLGRVTVFDFNGTTATLNGTIADVQASVAVEGDTVVTGYAPAGSGLFTNEVRVHRRTPSGWSLVAQLTPSDPSLVNGFGTAVDISNGRIAVGNPNGGTFLAPNGGAVVVFSPAFVGWAETAILRGDNDAGDSFGRTVAIDGDRIVVGATTDKSSDGTSLVSRGAAWLYENAATGWRSVTKIIPRDAANLDYVGTAVAIDGDTFAFTRIQQSFAATHDGVAYVYSATSASSNPFHYCAAGSTSGGCTPTMSWSGTPSASATTGFVLSANNAPGLRAALLVYGVTGQLYYESPGASSVLCVNVPRQRTLVMSTHGTPNSCDGTYSLDWSAYVASTPAALGLPLFAGERVDAQVWIRDQATTGGPNGLKHLVMSDAIEFELAP